MSKNRNFTRTIENFCCENCQQEVLGNGYTNHCPNCLFSKHVDIKPGDRAEACAGMMKPEEIEIRSGEYNIVHICSLCGARRRVKASKNDSMERILSVSRARASKLL